jgi:hypothetical protein
MSKRTLPKKYDRYGITAASCGTETCDIQSFKILARLPYRQHRRDIQDTRKD